MAAMPILTDEPLEQEQEQQAPILRDGLDAILQDHERLRDLHIQYMACPKTIEGPEGFDAKQLGRCLYLSKLVVEAASQHMSAVEKTIYPMIKYKVDPRKSARMLHDMVYMENKVGKDMLDFLDTHIPETSEDFELYDQQMDSYMTHLERLLRDEERQVVGRLRPLLSAEEKDTLFQSWAKAMDMAPKHPRPRSRMEKVKDAITGAVEDAVSKAGETMQDTSPAGEFWEAPKVH